MKALAVILVLGLGFCGTVRADDAIPVTSLDADGNSVTQYVSHDNYVEGVARMISAVHEEAMPVLNRAQQSTKVWWLRTLVLGIGLDMTVGFPPFFQLEFAPRFRAIFSNQTNPIVP